MRKLLIFAASAALFSGTSALAQGDECTGALAIVNGANGPFSNVGSTTSVPAWPCGAGGNDVWFSYTATCNGTAAVDTCGGGYDTTLEAFDACGGTSLACNDDFCNFQSSIAFSVTSGTTYFIRLGGFGGATGSAPLNVVCNAIVGCPGASLSTLFANNNGGNIGGGVYFDLNVTNPAGVTITSLDVNLLDAAGTPGTIEVYTISGTRTGNQTNIGAWTLASTGTVTAAGPGFPSAVTLGSPVVLGGSSSNGIAYRTIGVAHAYTNGNGANQTYSNADLTLNAGEASNAAFVAPLFTPRVVNTRFCYSIGTAGTVAVRENYGNRCYDCPESVYELFNDGPSFDLNGTSIRGTMGAAYVFSAGSPYLAPTGAATTLALTDDSEVTVVLPFTFPMPCGAASLTQFQVCSNGFISTASNGTSFVVSLPAALAFANTSWGTWHDFNPSAGGLVQTETEGGSGAFVVSWVGVPTFGTTNPNTWQMAFYPSGNVEWRFLTMDTVSANPSLVYHSPGGASADPGNLNMSAALAGGFRVCCAANVTAGLALNASARPLSGTTITLDTSNVPANAPFSAVLMNFSAVVPGIELSFLGMPGCYQNIALAGAVTLGIGFGPSWSQPFGVPASASYHGLNAFGQSVAIVPGVNAMGATSSNGLRLLVGNL